MEVDAGARSVADRDVGPGGVKFVIGPGCSGSE